MEDEIKTVTTIIDELEEWLNNDHSLIDYENKLKETNDKIHPIMAKLYKNDSTGVKEPEPDLGTSPDFTGGTIDEID